MLHWTDYKSITAAHQPTLKLLVDVALPEADGLRHAAILQVVWWVSGGSGDRQAELQGRPTG